MEETRAPVPDSPGPTEASELFWCLQRISDGSDAFVSPMLTVPAPSRLPASAGGTRSFEMNDPSAHRLERPGKGYKAP